MEPNNEPVKTDMMGLPRTEYVKLMRSRVKKACESVPLAKKSDLDKSWELRQRLLQVMRTKGWDVILRPGDIGYYDSERGDVMKDMLTETH